MIFSVTLYVEYTNTSTKNSRTIPPVYSCDLTNTLGGTCRADCSSYAVNHRFSTPLYHARCWLGRSQPGGVPLRLSARRTACSMHPEIYIYIPTPTPATAVVQGVEVQHSNVGGKVAVGQVIERIHYDARGTGECCSACAYWLCWAIFMIRCS